MAAQAVIGLLAHVDAGKTTLAEAMLHVSGAIRAAGRVDKGASHLDTDAMERARGITIFSAQAALDWKGAHFMLVDAPGHVDFSAEAERTLQALDYAILVVGANDGVQGHTETLWSLLERSVVPTFIFVNKMDLEHPGREALMRELRERLSAGCVDGAALLAGSEAALEDAAATDEAALGEYLESGALAAGTCARLVAERAIVPCFFGAALREEGVEGLLDGIVALIAERTWPEVFAARVYRVSRGARGERLAWLKVTGGILCAKDLVDGRGLRGEAWTEKIDEVRRYQGASFETVAEVPAGQVCAVTGLSQATPGCVLGAEPVGEQPVLAPVLSYQVIPSEGLDATALCASLRARTPCWASPGMSSCRKRMCSSWARSSRMWSASSCASATAWRFPSGRAASCSRRQSRRPSRAWAISSRFGIMPRYGSCSSPYRAARGWSSARAAPRTTSTAIGSGSS